MTFERLSARISEGLNGRLKEFSGTVEDIARNFRNLGFGTAVWIPDRIHTVNLGGVDADSYVGYSRIEGKWGLLIRTIERDHESRSFISQRVYTIESSRNIELVTNALANVRRLATSINEAAERQIQLFEGVGGEFEELREPNCAIK